LLEFCCMGILVSLVYIIPLRAWFRNFSEMVLEFGLQIH